MVEREVRAAADKASNVRRDLRWVPPEDVQTFFLASDLVVLPYRSVLNSGAVMLALTFGRPVLVPDLGAMGDQQATFGAEWIRLYAGDLTVTGLGATSTWARTTDRQALDLEPFDWRRLANRTCRIYATVLSRPPRAISSDRAEKSRTWTGV